MKEPVARTKQILCNVKATQFPSFDPTFPWISLQMSITRYGTQRRIEAKWKLLSVLQFVNGFNYIDNYIYAEVEILACET